MSVKLLTEHHFEFLSLKGGSAGSSESTLVKIPHCWKSHVTAHMLHLRNTYILPDSRFHYTVTVTIVRTRTQLIQLYISMCGSRKFCQRGSTTTLTTFFFLVGGERILNPLKAGHHRPTSETPFYAIMAQN